MKDTQKLEKEILDYFKKEDIAANAFLSKYSNNREESPEEMWERVVDQFYLKGLKNGGNSLSKEQLKEYITDFRYLIPQGSVLASLGLPEKYSSLSNCTVLPPVSDSYGGISNADAKMISLYKRRCGVGVDISKLRPDGAPVKNSSLTSTGAVSFMHRFSNTTLEVAQKGRRGALMLSMHINHPDSLSFITIKQDLTKVTGANISIQMTDPFMKAALNNEDYYLRFPVDLTDDYIKKKEADLGGFAKGQLIPIGKGKFVRKISAKEYWDTLSECAWKSAEPGLMFKTRHDDYCPSNIYPTFKNVTSNPCSEIYMGGHDSCRLMATNFFNFVINPFTDKAYFDWAKFEEIIYHSVRIIDDLVDLEIDALDNIISKLYADPEELEDLEPEIKMWEKFKEIGRKGRRAGLGFTGLGDTIAAFGFPYASEQGMNLTKQIVKRKFEIELRAQINLAKERGAFEGFDPELELKDSMRPESWFYFVRTEYPELWEEMQIHGRRSVSWNTTAPGGTISMLGRVSSGLEPVFMLRHTRRKKINPDDKDVRIDFVDDDGNSWMNFPQIHPRFKQWMELTGRLNGTPAELLPEETLAQFEKESPWHGSTAPEIDWINRVELQSIIQKYTTHSISSTINLPEDVSPEKVAEIYVESWKRGLKGITVYREGSRSGVLVDTKKDNTSSKFEEHHAPKRPESLECSILRFQNKYEEWIAFIGLMEGRPYEIFTGKSSGFPIPSYVEFGKIVKTKKNNSKRYDFVYEDKEGEEVTVEGLSTSFQEEYWNYSKLVSGILRHGMPMPYVISTIASLDLPDFINTWQKGVLRALKKFVPKGVVKQGAICSEEGCGGEIIYEEGCEKCKDCGISKCG